MNKTIQDKHGREIKPGDLLKVFHYVDGRTQRHCFLYKLVARVNDDLQLDPAGAHLYLVDVLDIAKQGSFCKAHKAPITSLQEFETVEIIDGQFGLDNVTWYERPKQEP